MIGQSAGKSFAYLLGVYLGDGCITAAKANGRHWRYVFRLNTIDADFAAATKAALHDIGCKTVCVSTYPVKASVRPNHALWASLDEEVLDGMVEMTDRKQKLPDDIMDWPRDLKLAFIAGLMDSEGYVAGKTGLTHGRRFYMGFKSCDVWVPDFIRLLESVGVRIGKVQTEAPRKAHYKPPTRFSIKMQSWIDAGCRFNIRRKQERVDEWAACPPSSPWGLTKTRRLTSETNMQDAA